MGFGGSETWAGSVWFVLAAGAVGALVGAVLPTSAYRLSVEDLKDPPRRICLACESPLCHGLRGWLLFGSRCGACGVRNGPPAWLLGVVSGVGCAGVAWRFGLVPEVVPYLAVVPLGCLLGAIDIACLRLPERLVWPAIAASIVAFGVAALAQGEWSRLLSAVIGGLALGATYMLLALLPGGQLGLGDVVLALLLGIYLGWLGPGYVILGGMAPFLVNLPVAIWVLVVRRGGRKADVPFGPAMLVGGYLVVVGVPLLAELLRQR